MNDKDFRTRERSRLRNMRVREKSAQKSIHFRKRKKIKKSPVFRAKTERFSI